MTAISRFYDGSQTKDNDNNQSFVLSWSWWQIAASANFNSQIIIKTCQMENDIVYEPVCLIYPGSYVPLLNQEEVKSALKRTQECKSHIPPVNILELTDSFRVEVAIPGVKREDFLVHSEGNILFVCVLHKKNGCQEGETFQLHEFEYNCFIRPIMLPSNADAEFSNAEYKEGILRLHIPKSDQPEKTCKTDIVVY